MILLYTLVLELREDQEVGVGLWGRHQSLNAKLRQHEAVSGIRMSGQSAGASLPLFFLQGITKIVLRAVETVASGCRGGPFRPSLVATAHRWNRGALTTLHRWKWRI